MKQHVKIKKPANDVSFDAGWNAGLRKTGLWIVASALALLVLFLFYPSVSGQFLSWDDADYILKDPRLHTLNWENISAIFSEFYLANYHPLTTLTWLAEYTLYGPDPTAFHWFNILLHAANTVLVFFLGRRLGLTLWPAALLSLLFGIHPFHVESVAWISERKDVLYTLFFIAGLITWSRYLEDRSQTRHYFVTLILFILALLSKSAAIVFPLVLWLMDYYFKRKQDRRMFLEKVPFLLLSLLFGVLAYMAQQSSGSVHHMEAYSGFEKFAVIVHSFAYYLVKVILPVHLSAVHLHSEYGIDAAMMLIRSLAYISIFLWPAFILKSNRRYYLFGLLFFAINIILYINIISIGRSVVNERYSYISYIGMFFLIAVLWQFISTRDGTKGRKIHKAYGLIMLAFCGFLFYQSAARIPVWNNNISLYQDVSVKYPENTFGYYYTATSYYEEGRFSESIDWFTRVIRLRPDHYDALNNRGNARYMSGDHTGAIQDYTKAIMVFPEFASAYHNRGSVYASKRDFRAAAADYQIAIRLNPAYTEAYYKLGLVYRLSGEHRDAVTAFTRAIELNSNNAEYYYQRGAAYLDMGRNSEACADLKTAAGMGLQAAEELMGEGCR